MRVLIIGGTGLISTGIVKALQGLGHEVLVFNRGQRESRLPDGVTYLHGNRGDRPAFEAAMREVEVDAVIDMIAFTEEDALSAQRAFRGRVKHFIHCSTVCTYGIALSRLPADEEEPLRPISGYGRNKVAADQAHLSAFQSGDWPVTIFKPSHTYGPGSPLIRQLGGDPRWIDRLRKRMPIIVAGDGNALWQAAYCDDVGLGFAAAVGRETCFGQTYNIVGPEMMTWNEYHQRVAAALSLPEPELVHVPTDTLLAIGGDRYGGLKEIFAHHGYYSNAKINRDIPEYVNQVSFEEGVRRNTAWMDETGQIEPAESDPLEDRIIAAQRAVVANAAG